MTDRKHSHYFRPFPYDNIDIYRFLEVFDVTCPVAQHIIKKAVATGKRGHKDLQRDWQDIVDSAQRKLEMLRENDLAWWGCSEEELGEIALNNKTIPVQPKEVVPVVVIPTHGIQTTGITDSQFLFTGVSKYDPVDFKG